MVRVKPIYRFFSLTRGDTYSYIRAPVGKRPTNFQTNSRSRLIRASERNFLTRFGSRIRLVSNNVFSKIKRQLQPNENFNRKLTETRLIGCTVPRGNRQPRVQEGFRSSWPALRHRKGSAAETRQLLANSIWRRLPRFASSTRRRGP